MLYTLCKAIATEVIRKLQKFVKHYGYSNKLLTDIDTQFSSNKWRKLLVENGIRQILTTVYHSQGNPIERYNREVGRTIRSYCSSEYVA